MPWSDDARVMVHPFHAYAELAVASEEDEHPRRTLALRVGLILLGIGGFVSLISAGRLVAFHVASTMVFWSFVPAAQAAVFAIVLRLFEPARARASGGIEGGGAPRRSLASALALYFTGHGPWLVFLLSLAGVCLLAPDVYGALTWLLGHGILPLAMLGTIVWSMVCTFACFRAGIGMPRGRAAGATALFYAGFTVAIVGYYLSMNQIQPQVPWAP